MAIFHSCVTNYQRVHQELWWRTNILHLIRWGFILKMDERDHNPFVERVRNQVFNENHLEKHLVSGVLGRKLIKGGKKPSCYWVYRLPYEMIVHGKSPWKCPNMSPGEWITTNAYDVDPLLCGWFMSRALWNSRLNFQGSPGFQGLFDAGIRRMSWNDGWKGVKEFLEPHFCHFTRFYRASCFENWLNQLFFYEHFDELFLAFLTWSPMLWNCFQYGFSGIIFLDLFLVDLFLLQLYN